MIAQHQIGSCGELSVWNGESPVPEFCSDGETILSESMIGSHGSIGYGRLIVMEAYLPKGPRIVYGLLGGRFIPGAHGIFEAVICHGRSDGRVYDKARCSFIEPAMLGLPFEFVAAVSNAMKQVPFLDHFPSGKLIISYSAFGESSSNLTVFEKLAFLLLRQLVQIEPVDSAVVADIFNE